MNDTQTYQTIRIERPLYEHQHLRKDFDYAERKENFFKERICKNKFNAKKVIESTIPLLRCLKNYDLKSDLLSDLISGFTVAIMHIPQGMAYALLGNVPPIIGIYMAFFPVIVYTFLGTSRHNSMGTFAVVCLMTGKTVLEHSHPSFHSAVPSSSNHSTTFIDGDLAPHMYSPIQVATTVTFTVALFQLSMYLLRLGAVSAILSDTLVNGFTTGAAVQVLTSQLKDLFGLKIPKHKGYFSLIYTYGSLIQEIGNVNYTAIIISAVTLVVCTFNNAILKPMASKHTSFPVPIELLVIVAGTTVSTLLDLNGRFNVSIVGNIPTGLPHFELPRFELMQSIVLDGFTIAIVSYTVTLSMALIFARKLNYEVDANQELLAQGTGNLVGSFFSCMPFSASLSRSMIQQTVGGKTQITSIVSCSLLLLVLLWVGPFFEPLPKCVLAALILAALRGMLSQVTSFFQFWKLSKEDATIWLSTFLTVILVGIDIGLLVGVCVSLIVLLVGGLRPYMCLLGQVPETDIYLDLTKYQSAMEIPGIKIVRYCGTLNFATRSSFTEQLHTLISMNPREEMEHKAKIDELTAIIESGKLMDNKKKVMKLQEVTKRVNVDLKSIILDLSPMNNIDPCGVGVIQTIAEDLKKLNISLSIAGCSDAAYNLMVKCKLLENDRSQIRCYATVSDAVLATNNNPEQNHLNMAVISRL